MDMMNQRLLQQHLKQQKHLLVSSRSSWSFLLLLLLLKLFTFSRYNYVLFMHKQQNYCIPYVLSYASSTVIAAAIAVASDDKDDE
jgi:hypothetical protein